MSIRRSGIGVVASALMLSGLACVPVTHGYQRALAPSAIDGRLLSFDLRSLAAGGRQVRAAHLSIRRAGRSAARARLPVALSRVRRMAGRGVIRVRAPRRTSLARRRGARLVLTLDRASAACAGGTGTGRWPEDCWRPYAATSPFNTPIPATAPTASGSDAIVARLATWGPPDPLVVGTADTAADFAHPTYYAQPGDPLFTLHCYQTSWGRCEIEGMTIRVPDAARPAAGSDAHMTVVDRAGGWEYDLYKVRSKPAGGGMLEFRFGGRTRLDGDGLGSAGTAARFGNLAGIIRAPEMYAGAINHALFMVVRCDSGAHVHPAAKTGRSCASIGLSNNDAPPMGARFQLMMSDAEIDGLLVPSWKKTILRAIARYGMYFGDTGGAGAWAIQAESGSTYTSFGAEERLVAFARANGVPEHDGTYTLDLRDDVDWAGRLRVVAACATRRTC